MEATGVNGQLEIDGKWLRISRRGKMAFFTQGLKGSKKILISSITAIQFKSAGLATNGYIQFSFMGGTESKRGLFGGTRDENTIIFSTKQQGEFINIEKELTK